MACVRWVTISREWNGIIHTRLYMYIRTTKNLSRIMTLGIFFFLDPSSVRFVRAYKRIWRIRMLCIQFQKVIQFLHCFQLIFELFAIMKECMRMRRRKNPHTRTGCNGYNVKSVRRNHQMRFTIEIDWMVRVRTRVNTMHCICIRTLRTNLYLCVSICCRLLARAERRKTHRETKKL